MRNTSFSFVLLLLWWLSAPAVAAETQNDIKLIIDVSGSMKKNDPDNLRGTAVNLLMNLLPEDAHAGVWLFGDRVEQLVPYGPVNAGFKANAIAQSQQIHSKGLYTNIGSALETAMLGQHPGGKAILLSDGMVDIGPDQALNDAEQSRIQRLLIPQLQAAGAEVHTVALSENADKDLLESVAKGSGGLFEVARTADDLTRVFLGLFDDALIQDRLPMDEGRFLVDSTVEEFTLLAFRVPGSAPVQLRSPNDEYYLPDDHPSEISWYQDAGFDLITISQPLEGEWRLFAEEDPQNRVTVLSDLKLDVTNLSNVLHEGSFPILEARFLQGSDVITDPEFLDLMDLQLIVLTPSGKRIAKPLDSPVNGIYASDLGVFAEPGRYRITVSVDGKTFQREVVQEVEYGSPARVVFSSTDRTVTVRPVAVGLLSNDLRMIARLEGADGKKRLLPMQSTGELWQVVLTDFADGQYKLAVHVKGVALTGQPLDFLLDRQTIELVPIEPAPTSEELPEMEEGWGLNQWLIVAAVVLGNLVVGGLGFWLYRRRKGDQAIDDTETEVSELLAEAPQPDSDIKLANGGETSADSGEAVETSEQATPTTSATDEEAEALAAAEAMRASEESRAVEDEVPAVADEKSAPVSVDEPEVEQNSADSSEAEEVPAAPASADGQFDAADTSKDTSEDSDSEAVIGGMSDIVDAWDSGDADADEAPELETDQASEEAEDEPEPEPEPDDAAITDESDDELMKEFQRAVDEQVGPEDDGSEEDESIDEDESGDEPAADSSSR